MLLMSSVVSSANKTDILVFIIKTYSFIYLAIGVTERALKIIPLKAYV